MGHSPLFDVYCLREQVKLMKEKSIGGKDCIFMQTQSVPHDKWAKLLSLLRSQLVRETACSFALKTTNAGLMFLSTVLLTRLLGATGYGIYAYSISLVTLLALPALAGLPNLVVRETAKGRTHGRPDLIKGVWQWAGRVAIALSLVLVGIGGPLLVMGQGGLKSLAGQTMAWALLLVPLITLSYLREAALRGLQRVILGQLPEFIVRPGLFLLFIGSLALLRSKALSPPIAMMLYAMASFLSFIIGAWFLWRHTPQIVGQSSPSVQTRGWLASSITFALMDGFNIVDQQASTVILGFFTTLDVVGCFQVAKQASILAVFGLDAINAVIAPRIAGLWAQNAKAHLQRLMTRSAQAAFAFSAFVTVAFVLIGQLFLQLVFGPEFNSSYLPALILFVGQMVNAVTGPVGLLLAMAGYERYVAKAKGIAMVVNILAGVALVPVLGIIGAAIAVSVSLAISNVLLWWNAHQHLGINSAVLSPYIINKGRRV